MSYNVRSRAAAQASRGPRPGLNDLCDQYERDVESSGKERRRHDDEGIPPIDAWNRVEHLAITLPQFESLYKNRRCKFSVTSVASGANRDID